jgi:hypothetical protein
VSADSTAWQGSDRLAWTEEVLPLAPGQTRVDLREARIDSLLSASMNGTSLQVGLDYRPVGDRGLLVLARPAAANDTLRVVYRFQPETLVEQLVLNDATHRLVSAQGDRPVRRPGSAEVPEKPGTGLGDLSIQGSKTVSIRGGTNRDATVDQGLNLSISGRLTEGIGVRAEISDQNLPITPEGNTEELTDLDEVRIELYGQRGRALLGDFRIDRSLGTFLPYQRKLEGIWLQGRSDRGSVQLLGGSPQGRRIEVELRGREGVQGPYDLLDAQRLQQSFIVAGSERVWLDGQLLTRGDGRDYVIDYVRGTVRFNENRPIGPESLIAVDFESSAAAYHRSVLGATVDSLRAGWLRLDAAVLREGDDPNRPLDSSLGEEERAVLAAAGDDPSAAVAGGVHPTAPGEGAYVQRTAGDGTVYYELADSTGGNFDVDFVFVGAGLGDYELTGITEGGRYEFVWRTMGGGDYRVGRRLELPQRTDVASFRVGVGDFEKGPGIDAEWNATRFDANRLSSKDDGDNGAAAFRMHAASPWWFREADGEGLRLRADFDRIPRNFVSSGRLRSPFFYEVFNLQDQKRDRDEEFTELEARWKDTSRSLQLRMRRLQRETDYRGTRWELPGSGVLFGPLSWEHLYAQTTADREDGRRSTRRDRRLRLLGRVKGWIPFVEARDHEFRDPRLGRWVGYRSGGWTAGLRDGESSRLEFMRDVGDSLSASGAEWGFARDVRQWRFLRSQNWTNTRLHTDLTWRTTRLPASQRATTRLARAQLSERLPDRGIALDLDYRAGTDQTRILGRRVVFAGLGEGDYDAEGNPVGPKQGDYNIVFTPSDSLVASTQVETNIQLSVESDLRWVGGFESRSLVQIEETSRSREIGALLRLQPSVLRQRDTTLYGRQRLREELHLLRRHQGIDLRLAYDSTDMLDQRFTEGPEETRRRKSLTQLELDLGRGWSLGTQAFEELRQRQSSDVANPELRSYDVLDRVASATLRLRTTSRRRYAAELRATRRRERAIDLGQWLFEVRPSMTTDWFGLNWTVEGRWSELTEEGPDNPRRPFFFERPGATKSASLRLQWASLGGFSVAVRYQILDEAQRVLRHDLGLETRARF